MSDTGFDRGYQLFREHAETMTEPAEVTVLGRTWDLSPGVFSPARTPVTELFSTWIPYPAGGSFMEIGCGAGVTAVTAALAGCAQVTALDISTAAVRNTRLNVERHQVAGRVQVEVSDMFDAIPTDDRYDVIFWNSNFAEPPAGFVNETDLHHAFFDPGYVAHQRYVRDGPGFLTAGGRLLLGFSSIGNYELLAELCRESGLDVHVVESQRRELEIPISFELLELRPSGSRAVSVEPPDPLR